MESLAHPSQLVKTFCVLDDLSVQLFEKIKEQTAQLGSLNDEEIKGDKNKK